MFSDPQKTPKYTKLLLVQDPSQSNVDNLNNVRSETSRHFRKKMKAYLTVKFVYVETNILMKNIRNCKGTSIILRMATGLELI